MDLLKTLAKRKSSLIWPAVLLVGAIVLKMTLFAPAQVKAVSVEKRDLASMVYGNGTVEAKVVVGVSSKITGRIVALYADQGDRVKRGQLLARLENDDVIHQERQSAAGLSKTAATLNIEQANLRKALANLALAEKNAQRFQILADKHLVSRLEAEQYDTACQVAKEEVTRCRAAIDAVRMEQQAGQAGLGSARSKVADTLIHAPQDGVIITRDLEKGATVAPGASIYTLADQGTIWVKANVDESQLQGVAIGRKALITLRSSAGAQLPGLVARLGQQSDRVTEELEVDVSFVEPPGQIRLGEQSEVHIITGTKNSAPALPSEAIIRKGRQPGVWIILNGRLLFRPVTVGIVDQSNWTEIVAGLEGRELIAVAPPARMAKFKDGMKVRVAR